MIGMDAIRRKIEQLELVVAIRTAVVASDWEKPRQIVRLTGR
jgi:hypothetical protein